MFIIADSHIILYTTTKIVIFMRKEYTRRKFIKSTLNAGVVIAGAQLAFYEISDSDNPF